MADTSGGLAYAGIRKEKFGASHVPREWPDIPGTRVRGMQASSDDAAVSGSEGLASLPVYLTYR